jgi:hypothetical protein
MELARRFPRARHLPVPPDTTIPRMREIAFGPGERRGRGGDRGSRHRAARMGPGSSSTRGAETGAVVGGSIDNAARSSIVDWAAFLCEYSPLS